MDENGGERQTETLTRERGRETNIDMDERNRDKQRHGRDREQIIGVGMANDLMKIEERMINCEA